MFEIDVNDFSDKNFVFEVFGPKRAGIKISQVF